MRWACLNPSKQGARYGKVITSKRAISGKSKILCTAFLATAISQYELYELQILVLLKADLNIFGDQ